MKTPRLIHFICIIIFSWIQITDSYSSYTCRGSLPWNITTDDNIEATRIFQNWLTARMNDFKKCQNKEVVRSVFEGHGIGSSIFSSIKEFIFALEAGKLYRPETPWLWADIAENCTFGINAYDCFSQPLSYCDHIPVSNIEQSTSCHRLVPKTEDTPVKGLLI